LFSELLYLIEIAGSRSTRLGLPAMTTFITNFMTIVIFVLQEIKETNKIKTIKIREDAETERKVISLASKSPKIKGDA
jgi:hypothetical protein